MSAKRGEAIRRTVTTLAFKKMDATSQKNQFYCIHPVGASPLKCRSAQNKGSVDSFDLSCAASCTTAPLVTKIISPSMPSDCKPGVLPKTMAQKRLSSVALCDTMLVPRIPKLAFPGSATAPRRPISILTTRLQVVDSSLPTSTPGLIIQLGFIAAQAFIIHRHTDSLLTRLRNDIFAKFPFCLWYLAARWATINGFSAKILTLFKHSSDSPSSLISLWHFINHNASTLLCQLKLQIRSAPRRRL